MRTSNGLFNVFDVIRCVLTNSVFIRLPVAPESMRAFAAAVSLFPNSVAFKKSEGEFECVKREIRMSGVIRFKSSMSMRVDRGVNRLERGAMGGLAIAAFVSLTENPCRPWTRSIL